MVIILSSWNRSKFNTIQSDPYIFFHRTYLASEQAHSPINGKISCDFNGSNIFEFEFTIFRSNIYKL